MQWSSRSQKQVRAIRNLFCERDREMGWRGVDCLRRQSTGSLSYSGTLINR
jgi:hypothetical protein